MGAPALRAGAPSQRRPAPKGRWPPPKKKVYKWEMVLAALEEVVGVSPDFRALGDWQLFSSPEEINDGKDTHPSARLEKAYRGYRKVLHGSQAVMRIGLERIREKCPHLDYWIRKLEEL
jgi:hypothetical protein